MKILIYEPLPDANRACFIRDLYRIFTAIGFEVLILAEIKLIYTLRMGSNVERRLLSNQFPVYHYFNGLNLEVMEIPDSLYNIHESECENNLKKISQIRFSSFDKVVNEFSPDRIFVWNGNHEHLGDFNQWIRQAGRVDELFYAEMAWFPQKGNIYFDNQGVAGLSEMAKKEWRKLPEEKEILIKRWLEKFNEEKELQNTSKGLKHVDVLVPLQIDSDSNITRFSPFSSMNEFVLFLQEWIPDNFSVVVRPHPKTRLNLVEESLPKNFRVDSEAPLFGLILNSSYVIGINSTVLIEALALNKKVIAFGNGIFDTVSSICKMKKLQPFPRDFEVDQDSRYSFLYHLVFEKQISLKAIRDRDLEEFQQKIPFTGAREEPDNGIQRKRKFNFFQRALGFVYVKSFLARYGTIYE